MSVELLGPRKEGGTLPEGWSERTFDPARFPRKSRYAVTGRGAETSLEASTDGGASFIFKDISVEPAAYPYLAWRWRVEKIFEKADETTRKGDDFPARLCLGFRFDATGASLGERLFFEIARLRSDAGKYPPRYVLCYVWAGKLKENTWAPSPWGERSGVIAVRSGAAGLGKWRFEIRDYVGDFRAIKGVSPPSVDFVALMIDGDGTGSSGTSYFRKIELLAEPPPCLAGEISEPPKRSSLAPVKAMDRIR